MVGSQTGRPRVLVVAWLAIAIALAGAGPVPDRSVAPGPAVAPGAAISRAAAGHDAAPAWRWPVAQVRLVKAYAAPATRYGAGHRGVDLAAEPGEQMVAPAEGVVRFSGVVVDRPVLTLDHGGGVLSSYEPVAGSAEVGAPVARGAPIGVVATGGHCDGCLHVGVRVDGAYVSPLLFFDRVPRSVLLPPGVTPSGGRAGRSP